MSGPSSTALLWSGLGGGGGPAFQPLDFHLLGAEAHGLTPRESEIIVHLGQGRTARAISEKLVVSENTVKYHIKSIYRKLDVHSRDEVIDDILDQYEQHMHFLHVVR